MGCKALAVPPPQSHRGERDNRGYTRGFSPLDSPEDRATKRRMSEEHAESIVVKLDQELMERFKYKVNEISTLGWYVTEFLGNDFFVFDENTIFAYGAARPGEPQTFQEYWHVPFYKREAAVAIVVGKETKVPEAEDADKRAKQI